MHSHLPPIPSGATFAHEAVSALVAGAAFLSVLAMAEIWRRTRRPPVEWTRKFVHMGGGLVTAFFPWMFGSQWTILALGSVLVALFTAGRRFGWFRSVTAVERHSSGERWFPIGVYLLFLAARSQPVFYLIALSALVVADSLAALLGARFGRHRYEVAGGTKSLEGSAAFLVVAFAGVFLPLRFLADVGAAPSLLIALQLALLSTSFEAISERGNDNVVVPLATYYLLVKMTPTTWENIAFQLGIQLVLLVVSLVVAWKSRLLSFAGALAAHLVLYAAFSLGGPAWIVAPFIVLVCLAALDAPRRTVPFRPPGGHQVRGVFYVSIVAVALLFLDNSLATWPPAQRGLARGHPFHALFVGALAAPLAIALGERLLPRGGWRAFGRWLAAGVAGYVLVVPAGLWAHGTEHPLQDFGSGALLVLGSVLLYGLFQFRRSDPPGAVRELTQMAASIAFSTVLVTPLHLARIGGLP